MRSSVFGRLFALFLLVPALELILLIWIGEHVGFWPTVGLIMLTALVGSWLAKHEGMAALRRFQSRLASGQMPGRELTDGLIILVAGALLLTPGILTDLAGLFGLFPPTRAWIRSRLEARMQRAIARGEAGIFVMQRGRVAPPPAPTSPPEPVRVEDATILEED